MFNEIHEIQSKRYELSKLTSDLMLDAGTSHEDLVDKLNEADDLLCDLHSIYGECIDIIEE